MNNITIGIFGAGRIGLVHLEALASLPNISIKTLADPFMNASLEAKVKALGVQQVSKNADDVFADKEIQAVFICSPSDTHSDFSLKAIAQNKHVFCEKPIDHDLARIQKVVHALKDKNLVYQVGFNRRFDHNFLAVKEALTEHKIGKPQMLRITSRDPAAPTLDYIKSSGGLFMDMMIHDFDMARFQTGSEVEEVYALGGVLVDEAIANAGDIDSAIVTLKFKNGMIGIIENCRQAVYGYDQRIEILGTEGAVHIGNDSQSTAVVSNASGIVAEKPLHFFLERYKHAYIQEQKAFFAAINATESRSVTLHDGNFGAISPCNVIDGLEAVRIAYAARLSLKERRPVTLKEIPAV